MILFIDEISEFTEAQWFWLKIRILERKAKQNVHISIMRSIDNANQELNAKLNSLRHELNDQLIDLKYGKGYKASFLDEILIQANNL